MSYYRRLELGVQEMYAAFAKENARKRKHFEESGNCGCKDCKDVVFTNGLIEQQKIREAEEAANPKPKVERKIHKCDKGTSICNYYDSERKGYFCRHCDERL